MALAAPFGCAQGRLLKPCPFKAAPNMELVLLRGQTALGMAYFRAGTLPQRLKPTHNSGLIAGLKACAAPKRVLIGELWILCEGTDSFAPLGLIESPAFTHGLRRGLHS